MKTEAAIMGSALSDEDKAEFQRELQATPASDVPACIDAWGRTARAFGNPKVKSALTAPGDNDYSEATSPV